jgi:hypothetical protein
MKILIGSECMGIWGKDILDYLFYKLNNNIEVSYENNMDCNFIIKSVFTDLEKEWNTNLKKYIYWSGEYYLPKDSIYHTKRLYIITTINNDFENIYIPYFLFSSHLYKERIAKNINRKYLLAYCSARQIDHREEIYNTFVENSPENSCHAIGKCFGKYENTKLNSIPGGWTNIELIHAYTDYKFVLAIENTNHHGYVTEKIVNAFYSGAIPIYWGCNTVTKYFNKKAFINVNDFSSFEECVKYVINLDDDTIQKMYNEPIYTNDELTNLLNNEYNTNNTNNTLNSYLDMLKDFLE